MTSLTDIPQLKKDNRMVGVGLAAAAGLGLLVASLTHGWLVNKGYNIGVSLWSMCMGDECKSNFGVYSMAKEAAEHVNRDPEVSSMWPVAGVITIACCIAGGLAVAGVITIACCIAGGLALLATAFFGFQKKRVTWPVQPTTVALLGIMIGLITGCVFIATKPGGVGGVGVGWSFWVYGIGSILGIVGAQILNKLIKPVDPDFDPMKV
jgi:hypothetical protein